MYFGLPDDAIALRDGLREVLSSACTPATIRAALGRRPLRRPLEDPRLSTASSACWCRRTRGGLGLDELVLRRGHGGVRLRRRARACSSRPSPRSRTRTCRPTAQCAWLWRVPAAWCPTRPSPLTLDGRRSRTCHRSRRSTGLAGWVAALRGRMPAELHCQLGDGRVPARAGAAAGGHDGRVRQGAQAVRRTRSASFQAVKHPLADAVVGTELAWPVVLHAAHALATGAADASMRVSHAKAAASDAAYKVSRVCLQAHGAIGYTVEYDLHLFMKRTWALAQDWGSRVRPPHEDREGAALMSEDAPVGTRSAGLSRS